MIPPLAEMGSFCPAEGCNVLPALVVLAVLFGPAIAVYLLLTLRERREQGR